MTEYGRSPGSEPWHPGDPLYGDQGWEGQQQQYPHPQQASQYGQGGQVYQDPYGQGGHAAQGGQGYEGDPYQQHGQQQAQQYQQQPQGYVDPQYQQQYQQQSYEQQQYGQTAYQGGYDTPGHLGQQYDGNWETGQASMAYGTPPADPYGGQNPDLYGTPEAYPPPQPPGRRQNPPEPVIDWEPEEEARPEPEEEKHPFFTGEDAPDDEDEGYDEEPGRGRGSRGGDRERRSKSKKRKGKNGAACLVVALVMAGGVGGIGYFGYQFWQGQFGAVEDYAGTGSGDVQVEIPKGALGNEIGNILKKAGVVKSVDAFTSAQQKNPKGISIQAGVYTLKKGMSAESAVTLMLNPASQSNFVIPEGRRNVWVYEQIDKKLGLEVGTTKDIAKAKANELGLPDWAKNHKNVKDPLEGFLFPASYPVAKGTKPEDALRKMVSRASQEYDKLDLEAKAQALGVDGPWELVTIASLVQAEGVSHDDFRKMAEVVYNRLKPSNPQTYGGLEFDSTYNYIKNQSKLDLTLEELRKYDNPYNTYFVKGLPPGPIGNPGVEAMQGVVSPTSDGWYYFISIDGKTSQFTKTNAEHQKLVEKFNESRKN
ncbi:endolytic transglycosylase MltG [Streptomyces sp. SR27]|uniref:endolytic transglycosylase MltG n=1 Tax=Streptomyces sp. SR27 TaxID=3076630 RepID=UPI00295B7B09|nr:endolytic transglycosylase MltG [Streptomyces sp. SR27]MDV9188477.1 endolytic transglycosylase MltG [Streptomyces sp. SR27]